MSLPRFLQSEWFAPVVLAASIGGLAILFGDAWTCPEPSRSEDVVVPMAGPVDWPSERVRAIYHEAVALPPAERAAYLERVLRDPSLPPSDAARIRKARWLMEMPVSRKAAD